MMQSNNSLVEIPTVENLLLSGGAIGADYKFGKYAYQAGHSVVHWSFDGHRSECPPQHIVKLSSEHLMAADDAVKRANKSLERRYPTKNESTNNLLRRNYYQVRWSSMVYAVSHLENNGMVSGGTGWAVQIYMDRFIFDGGYPEDCHLYLYDQIKNQWLLWRGSWTNIEKPPRPSGIYAGIGTRKLTDQGEKAIASLYE